ncbi:glycosyltransferase family 39 protein [Chloroflexota bacterium]
MPSHHPRGMLWLRFHMPLLFIILLALVLQLYGLESKSLWHDELGTLRNAGWGGSWIDAIRNPLTIPTLPKPPLSFLVTRIFMVLGDRAFALRLPSVLFATLTIPLVYAFGTLLFGRRVGLLAAFLLAIAPLHIRYAQEARMYSMLAFFSLLSLYFFWRAIRARSGWLWFWFATVATLNLYTHQFAFLSLGVLTLFGLWLLIDSRARPQFPFRAWHLFASLAGIFLAYLPMLSYLVEGLLSEEGVGGNAPPAFGELAWNLASIASAFRLFSGGNDVGLALYVVLFALAVVVLVARLRGHMQSSAGNPQGDSGWGFRTSRALVLLIGWIVLPMAIVLSVPTGHGVRIRYLIFLLPVYLLLVAYGLDVIILWLGSRLSTPSVSRIPERVILVLVTIALLAILIAISVPSVASYYAESKQNWRDATWLVQAAASPGDRVFVSRGHHRAGVLFYAAQWMGGPNLLTEENVGDFPNNPTEDLLPEGTDRGWLIVPLQEEYLPGGDLDSRLSPHYRLLPPDILSPPIVPKDSPLLGPIIFRSLAVVPVERLKPPSITFSVDEDSIPNGGCTWLRWEVENVREVFVDSVGVVGHGELEVCPTTTTTFRLEAIPVHGETIVHKVEILVTPP